MEHRSMCLFFILLPPYNISLLNTIFNVVSLSQKIKTTIMSRNNQIMAIKHKFFISFTYISTISNINKRTSIVRI